jgi:hypothetical protein
VDKRTLRMLLYFLILVEVSIILALLGRFVP